VADIVKMLGTLFGYLRGLLRAPSFDGWRPFQLDSGFTLIRRHGELRIAEHAHLWPRVKISLIGTRETPARVRIGRWSSIGDRTQIHACRSIEIGDRVMISWDVTLLENNYHANSRGPIRIEDDVWIGCHAIILSGITVGRGAVVAAGAVVTKDVPPHTLVAGNPARAIREITAEYREASGMVRL
jgi:acetyltransferase-like isoleucine patch superfamily enzyme